MLNNFWYVNAIHLTFLQDIVQSKPSSFPISSLELFSILDDASEKTCLWGTAVSMQKHLLDGGAGKIGLEPENVVAWTSFLLEQKLVIVFHIFKICSQNPPPPPPSIFYRFSCVSSCWGIRFGFSTDVILWVTLGLEFV